MNNEIKKNTAELNDNDMEKVTGGDMGGTNEWIIGIHKNNNNGNALSDDDLGNVGAGTAPELPATQLANSNYASNETVKLESDIRESLDKLLGDNN